MRSMLGNGNPYRGRFDMKSKPRKRVSLVYCEHCRTRVSPPVYARNHGDKCPYKGANKDSKICKTCNNSVELKDYYRSSAKTFDGLASTCRFCMLEKIQEKRDEKRREEYEAVAVF